MSWTGDVSSCTGEDHVFRRMRSRSGVQSIHLVDDAELEELRCKVGMQLVSSLLTEPQTRQLLTQYQKYPLDPIYLNTGPSIVSSS